MILYPFTARPQDGDRYWNKRKGPLLSEKYAAENNLNLNSYFSLIISPENDQLWLHFDFTGILNTAQLGVNDTNGMPCVKHSFF